MSKLTLARRVSAVVALVSTPIVALAAETGEPSFHITAGGWWSLLGTAIFSAGIVWAMRKVS